MTVGEKIQFYRKKIGISQEELGQKLFVSRQTISLWEMDKTLPTVDNLVRLREIFSVSIDDILSEADPSEAKTDAKETYRFQYSKDDLRGVYKASVRPVVKRFIIFTVALAVLFVMLVSTNAPDAIIGMVLGIFFFGIATYIKTLVVYKKTWNAHEKRILEGVYQYDVYDTHFVLNVSKNGEVTKTCKIYFEEIEKINALGKYLIIQHGGQSYIIDKNSLNEDSHLRTFFNAHPEKVETKTEKGPLNTVSILLFVFSILSIFGAMICLSFVSERNWAITENMWIFFLFTPIPIASVIFGYWLKKKGKKYKKNVIAGIVVAVLLCLYGSFTFIFAGIYSHDDAPILRIEETLLIDIPEYKHINTQDWTKGTQTTRRGYIYSTSDVYFDEDAVGDFEYAMSYDYRWISVIPNDLVGITSAFCDTKAYDYFLIYNVNTGEFNQLPSESGKYSFINVLYNTQSNTMKIVEYEIEYVK